MQTKLTLRLDQDLIRSAKEYSARTGKSLSQIVADYFLLIQQSKLENHAQSLPPITQSLKGALKGTSISEDDYRDYLEEKYL